jgi:hypothetical protein
MTRVQVELDPRAFEELNKLKERFGAASYAEVIRRSLDLHTKIVERSDRGATIISRDPDGTENEIWVI